MSSCLKNIYEEYFKMKIDLLCILYFCVFKKFVLNLNLVYKVVNNFYIFY